MLVWARGSRTGHQTGETAVGILMPWVVCVNWILRTTFLTKPLNHTVPRESVLSTFKSGKGWTLAGGHGPLITSPATTCHFSTTEPGVFHNPEIHSARELRTGCWNISSLWFSVFFESAVNCCCDSAAASGHTAGTSCIFSG